MVVSILLAFNSVLAMDFYPVEESARHKRLEKIFHKSIDKVEKFYKPYFESLGKTFNIYRDWQEDIPNIKALATSEVDYYMDVYGGILRKPGMNQDAFEFILCHEVGHYLGTGPKVPEYYLLEFPYLSVVEGEADYYATSNCLKRLWQDEKNINRGFRAYSYPPCDEAFENLEKRYLCKRSVNAVNTFFAPFSPVNNLLVPYLAQAKADRSKTYPFRFGSDVYHPSDACRIEASIAGALCPIAPNDTPFIETSKYECTFTGRYPQYSRPLCYYGVGGVLKFELPKLENKQQALENLLALPIDKFQHTQYEDDEVLLEEEQLLELYPQFKKFYQKPR